MIRFGLRYRGRILNRAETGVALEAVRTRLIGRLQLDPARQQLSYAVDLTPANGWPIRSDILGPVTIFLVRGACLRGIDLFSVG